MVTVFSSWRAANKAARRERKEKWRALTKEEIKALAKLPGLEVLRAQLLGLLTQPATGFVRVINAVPQGLLNVLQAKARN